MKSILVPIDFSTCVENALKYAIVLAEKLDATIEVLHVGALMAKDIENSSIAKVVINDTIKQAKKRMDQSIQNAIDNIIFSTNAMYVIHANIEMGVVVDKICEVALGYQVDLIVMGACGQKQDVEKKLGRTTIEVLQRSSCPVLVIPTSANS